MLIKALLTAAAAASLMAGGAAYAGGGDHAKTTAQAPAPADASAQIPADEGIDVGEDGRTVDRPPGAAVTAT